MKVAIFGGTGFVGSYIIDELIKNKHKPIVLVRSGSEHKLIQKDKCKIVTGDLNDHNAIEKTIKSAESVIYTIGLVGIRGTRSLTHCGRQTHSITCT